MIKSFLTVLLAFVTVVPFSYGSEIDIKQIEKRLDSNLVTAIYTLQYDEYGEVPPALGLFCSSCNKLHYDDLSDMLENNRDLELTGFAVAPDLVLIPDIMIDSKAVKKLSVRYGSQTVMATVIKLYPNEGMLLAKLEKPLNKLKPITLTSWKKGEKLYAYSRIEENGQWISRLKPFAPGSPQLWNGSRISCEMPGSSLVVNAAGESVAILGNNNELLGSDRWDLPYTQWKAVDMEHLAIWKKALEERLKKAVWPVTIYFREQKLSNSERLRRNNTLNEMYTMAYKLPGGEICMPLLLSPAQCALLDKVVVHTVAGDVEASVISVFRDFGCMQLKLRRDVPWETLASKIEPMHKELGMQVWAADINVFKKSVRIRVNANAIGAMMRGFAGQQYGFVIKRDHKLVVYEDILFSLDGKLLGLRFAVRSIDYDGPLGLLDAGALAGLFADKQQNLPFKAMCNPRDSVADLGIEYQNMTNELAKTLNLEAITRNGRDGLLISYVYAGSTAEKIGLKPGDVLLKLMIPNMCKMLRLERDRFAVHQAQQFPWQQLDRIPEMYYGEIPEPWNSVKNALNNYLTAIGIGQKVELIVFSNGNVSRKEFVIAAAPVYYEIAPVYSSKSFGLEVRNMTYEVRRYFRMNEKTPGVIISNVFAGSSASTAGLKPFEIITAVNDKPVHTVEEFRKALEGVSELRLSVRRLASNRVVTVKAKVGPRR